MATTLEARNISLNAALQERSLQPPPAPFSNSPHVHPSPWWYPDGSPPRPTVPANNDDGHLLLLLLVLIPIAPFLVVAVCLCIYWFSNNNTTEDVTRDEVATAGRGLDKEVIESFPTMLYSEVKHFNLRRRGTLECAVCLSEFDGADVLRLLPHCTHAFHLDCIDMWLVSHDTCPVCRAELTPSSAPPVAAGETPPVQVFLPVEEVVQPETMEEEEARVGAEEESERFTLRLPDGLRAGVVSRGMDREVGSYGSEEFEEGCEGMGELRLGEVGRMGYAEEDVVAAVVARGQRGRD